MGFNRLLSSEAEKGRKKPVEADQITEGKWGFVTFCKSRHYEYDTESVFLRSPGQDSVRGFTRTLMVEPNTRSLGFPRESRDV